MPTPSTPLTDCPTVVAKPGLSEPIKRLKADARWWLTNSGDDVKIVVFTVFPAGQVGQAIVKPGPACQNSLGSCLAQL